MTDVAVLLLRVWLGVVMVAHGYHHARSLEGTTRWFASKGFRNARLFAGFSAAGEFAIGAGLIIGFLTPFAAAGLVAVAATAFWTIHRLAGFYVFSRPDEGWEYVTTLAVAAVVLALLGPGRYSIDAALGWAGSLAGGMGAAIVAGGIVLAALQLAVGWRKPAD